MKYIGAMTALFAVLIALALALPAGTAFAEDVVGDAFDVVFPLSDYFQSLDPTLISSNDDFLIVFDDEQKALFVRSQETSTYRYDLSSLKNVVGVHAVGHHAFIVTGSAPEFGVYKLDLTNMLSAPEAVEIPSPDHISYIASDGALLYAKNSAGNLSIFDEELNVALGIDNIYNYDVLTGQSALAAENGLIYLFATDDKSVAHLYVFDSMQNELLLDAPTPFIQSAYIGDVIFAQISPAEEIEGHSQIVCLNKANGEKLCDLQVAPDSYCAYKDTLYAINDNKIAVYRLHVDEEGVYSLDREEVISMAGDDLRHLNAPADVVAIDGKLYVADSLNRRLAEIETVVNEDGSVKAAGNALAPYPLNGKPIALTADETGIYVLLEGGEISRYSIKGDVPAKDDSFAAALEGAIDIQYCAGNLYAITADGLYGYFADGFIKCANIDGAARLTSAKDGETLYALYDGEKSGVMLFDRSACLVTSLACEGGAKDISVDYAGNVFLLFEDRVEFYKNNALSLDKTGQTPFVSSTVRAEASSCFLDGDRLYFTAEECFIGAMSVDAVQKDDFDGKAPAISSSTAYTFAKQTVQSSFSLPADGRADGIKPLKLGEGEALLILDIEAPYPDMSYALRADVLMLVPTGDFEQVAPTPIDKEYFLKSDCDLFALPYVAEAVSKPKDTRVTLISDCAGYDGNKWSLISLEGSVYFVETDLIDEYVPPIYEPDSPSEGKKPKTLYGRAKADRVGGVVNIYDDLHETSALTDIVDGRRVEILAEYESYYKVKYGDVTGYMRKDEVKIGGLTTVQTVAIVLSIAVLLAGTGIFISIHALKNRNDKENLTQ